jgi:hypothetical protein
MPNEFLDGDFGVVPCFGVASSLGFDLGAPRRHYNNQIKARPDFFEHCLNLKMRNSPKHKLGTTLAIPPQIKTMRKIMERAIIKRFDPTELLFLPLPASRHDRPFPN